MVLLPHFGMHSFRQLPTFWLMSVSEFGMGTPFTGKENSMGQWKARGAKAPGWPLRGTCDI